MAIFWHRFPALREHVGVQKARQGSSAAAALPELTSGEAPPMGNPIGNQDFAERDAGQFSAPPRETCEALWTRRVRRPRFQRTSPQQRPPELRAQAAR